MKIKIKKRHKAFKVWYIVSVLIIIMVIMSTSYSLWKTELNIEGNIKVTYTEQQLPIQIPSRGEVDNIERFTTNTEMTALATTIYRVTAEEYVGNTITTTIKHEYKQVTNWVYPDVKITFQIPNTTDKTFTNGKIELVSSNDPNGVWTDMGYSTSNATIEPGGSAEMSVTGTLRGNQNVADNTYYNFNITYRIDGVIHYFHYNVKLLPR